MLTVIVAAGLIWATRLEILNDTLIYLGLKPDRFLMVGRGCPDTFFPAAIITILHTAGRRCLPLQCFFAI
jgi:hypothetical protein